MVMASSVVTNSVIVLMQLFVHILPGDVMTQTSRVQLRDFRPLELKGVHSHPLSKGSGQHFPGVWLMVR